MQARDGSRTTPTLVICGWTARTASLLQAVEARGLVPVAVADHSAAALGAAAATFRGRIEAPARYQHPREMLRRTSGTTVLLDMPAATEAAEASRGASVLVAGDAIEPEALDALARGSAAASIVRPLWCSAPLAAFVEVARSSGHLSSLTLAAGEDRPAQAIAEDLVSLAARLGNGGVTSVTSSAYAPPHRDVGSVVTGLRFGDNVTALVVARRVRDAFIRAELTSSATSVIAAGDRSGATITVARTGRGTTTTRLAERDDVALAVEAALEELAAGGVGHQRLSEEASLLRRFRASLDSSGDAVPTRWSVLAGGGQLSTPRRGHLHLVSA